ncbi:MAG: DUF4097 domain-containing protein [Gemmatimonadota bacterium]|nr:DUF4097 domain-containing protein [Gemmatimonadota bacterium]
MKRAHVLLGAALIAGATTLSAQAKQPENGEKFDWSGRVPSGAWLRVLNINGSVDVEPASGDQASIHGEKQWRRGDPAWVRFEVVKSGDNVIVCALWNDNDTCDERGIHSHGHNDRGERRNNDVNVHFTVKLPKGVKIDASTVNGAVDVRGATTEVEATSVNGRVEATSSGGPVTGSSVNGDVTAHMEQLTGSSDLRFTTVNGSITVDMPGKLDADVEMETVNGSIRSDYPMTIEGGRISPKHLRAKIGSGGRRIRFTTVNGSITLRKLN